MKLVRVRYITKYLTRGKAGAFTEGKNFIVKKYHNGKGRMTEYFKFVEIIPDGKYIFDRTYLIPENKIYSII